jgi:hypothetical protein
MLGAAVADLAAFAALRARSAGPTQWRGVRGRSGRPSSRSWRRRRKYMSHRLCTAHCCMVQSAAFLPRAAQSFAKYAASRTIARFARHRLIFS